MEITYNSTTIKLESDCEKVETVTEEGKPYVIVTTKVHFDDDKEFLDGLMDILEAQQNDFNHRVDFVVEDLSYTGCYIVYVDWMELDYSTVPISDMQIKFAYDEVS